VISRTTERFRACFARLPDSVRQDAKHAFALFAQNPYDHRLHFKRVHGTRPIYSARVGSKGYRAVGNRVGNEIDWYWIGPHDEYERVIQE
jgi:hypothetical protein